MGKETRSLDRALECKDAFEMSGLNGSGDHQTESVGQKPLKRGFFNMVANRLATARIGDLLVDSGLITKDQLTEALALQRGSKRALGEVLVELGAISPVNLYRKLAEQWVIKASAAGLTMMISAGTLSPKTASAAETGASYSTAQVTLASAVTTTNYKLPNRNYPALFGSREVRSNDISGFTNWTGMMKRFEVSLKRSAGDQNVRKWKSGLARLQGKPLSAKIAGVNSLMNQKRYVTDNKNWNKSDYWATPVEFMSRGGDCEDFAIAKYASLRALGVPADQMRLAIVLDKKLGIHHAILIVYDAGKAYVLDNQDKAVRELAQVKRYKPIFSINQQSWWLHKKA